jgi:calglandulin
VSEDEIRRAFKVFDKYNDGKIRVDLLRSVLSKVGEPLSEKELTNFLEMMNLSDKDTIDYEELCSTMASYDM